MLEITITKSKTGHVKIVHTKDADTHEMIGVLATIMNHLTMHAQGIDATQLTQQCQEPQACVFTK